MTLRETVMAIEWTALAQPAVRTVVPNDVFRLNALPDVRYGVFAWTQQQHRGDVAGDLHSFSFSLFYVDRLTEDKGNELEVQSTGVQTLENILRTLALRGIVPADGYQMQTFNQRFMDECAGVFCTVRLEVPADTLCEYDYADPGQDPEPGDYDGGFNDDYLKNIDAI